MQIFRELGKDCWKSICSPNSNQNFWPRTKYCPNGAPKCRLYSLSYFLCSMHCPAWYDYDLVAYQKGRIDSELEITLQEESKKKKKGIKAQHLKPKEKKDSDTEWQKTVKKKKNEEYYNKLALVENEQLVKEQRLREEKHQFAIPGEKIVGQSIAKGMASAYEETL